MRCGFLAAAKACIGASGFAEAVSAAADFADFALGFPSVASGEPAAAFEAPISVPADTLRPSGMSAIAGRCVGTRTTRGLRVLPATHLPSWQLSLTVQMLPSASQPVPFKGKPTKLQLPVFLSHASTVHGFLSSHTTALPAFLAIVTLSPTIVLLAGWSANSKFPFIGGLRALFQQTAYEIPLWLSALGVVMITGTLNLTGIVQFQQNNGWLILPQALGAVLFIVTSTAEMERLPFDLPEAESEIMMGWQAEYPGPLFMLVQGPAFIKLYAFAALFSTLYLGGYLGPAIIPPIVWFFLKTIVIIVAIMLFRSTFPRVRLDQLLRQGWTTLLTLSIVNIVIAYFIVVGVPAI